MNNSIANDLSERVSLLKGKKCWYVSTGGAAGSTFQLAMGEKIEREAPLKNLSHTEEYRRFEGEIGLLVWCAWRLDGLHSPVTSWDDQNDSVEAGLSQLVGASIKSIEVVAPAWDLNVEFSNSLFLRVFCDHVGMDPSFEGNWDLFMGDVVVATGPGAKFRIDNRNHVLQAPLSK